MNRILPKNKDFILTNAKLVLADEVIQGTIVVKNGLIDSIDHGRCALSQSIDCNGSYLSAGLVELHTDNLERHLEPRPGVNWPIKTAAIAHDAELYGCGVTTVFDAMRVGSIPTGSGQYAAYARGLADAILGLKEKGLLKISHFLHLRAEICSATLSEELASFSNNDQVGIVSLMDHTPGQRQFRNMDKFKAYVTGKKKLDEDGYNQHVEMLKTLRNENGKRHENITVEEAARLGAVLASHDDTTTEHVKVSKSRGIKVAEFPTTLEAAKACRKNGISIMMGAPNLIRGGSHSGNVSALELAQNELLDVISSDYVPAALLQSAIQLGDLWGDLPKALRTVTLNPARAAGFSDRGEIALGQRADLICFSMDDNHGIIESVFVG